MDFSARLAEQGPGEFNTWEEATVDADTKVKLITLKDVFTFPSLMIIRKTNYSFRIHHSQYKVTLIRP